MYVVLSFELAPDDYSWSSGFSQEYLFCCVVFEGVGFIYDVVGWGPGFTVKLLRHNSGVLCRHTG